MGLSAKLVSLIVVLSAWTIKKQASIDITYIGSILIGEWTHGLVMQVCDLMRKGKWKSAVNEIWQKLRLPRPLLLPLPQVLQLPPLHYRQQRLKKMAVVQVLVG